VWFFSMSIWRTRVLIIGLNFIAPNINEITNQKTWTAPFCKIAMNPTSLLGEWSQLWWVELRPCSTKLYLTLMRGAQFHHISIFSHFKPYDLSILYMSIDFELVMLFFAKLWIFHDFLFCPLIVSFGPVWSFFRPRALLLWLLSLIYLTKVFFWGVRGGMRDLLWYIFIKLHFGHTNFFLYNKKKVIFLMKFWYF
jgi:hypothetical protein